MVLNYCNYLPSEVEENQTTLSIERSLADQNNQISSTAKFSLSSDLIGTNSGDIFMADFNLDGLDDVVYSEPESSTQKPSQITGEFLYIIACKNRGFFCC